MPEEEVSENKSLIKDYEKYMSQSGKKSHNAFDYLMSMPKYKRMSKDQMTKIIGDAKRKGIFKEDETSAVMDILAKHPAEYKALKDGESLYDQANLFDALFQYFSATGDMPYGTQKARDGDPYEWIEDKLDDLDLLENVAEEETASSRQDLESSLNNLYNILTTINSDDQSDALQSKEEELMADELIGTIAEFKARIEGDVGSFADESVEESAEDAARLLKSVVEDALDEAKKKPIPTSPDKWSRAKAKARSKFDVYPSAYANAYAAKEYKKMGGGWRMGKKKKK